MHSSFQYRSIINGHYIDGVYGADVDYRFQGLQLSYEFFQAETNRIVLMLFVIFLDRLSILFSILFYFILLLYIVAFLLTLSLLILFYLCKRQTVKEQYYLSII